MKQALSQVIQAASKIDMALLKWTGNAYLWFLDRTGTYVGTLIAVLMFLQMGMVTVLSHHDGSWPPIWEVALLCLLLFVVGADSTVRWNLQHMGANLYNAYVSSYFRTRHITFVFSSFCVPALIERPKFLLPQLMYVFVFSYLMCIPVRDREPPRKREWFGKLATVSSSMR